MQYYTKSLFQDLYYLKFLFYQIVRQIQQNGLTKDLANI